MSVQDAMMTAAMLEAAVRECGTIVIRECHWEAVTLDATILCKKRSDGARVLTLVEGAEETTDD